MQADPAMIRALIAAAFIIPAVAAIICHLCGLPS